MREWGCARDGGLKVVCMRKVGAYDVFRLADGLTLPVCFGSCMALGGCLRTGERFKFCGKFSPAGMAF